jgi:uncharacterized protein YjeT (DUF2065 family)
VGVELLTFLGLALLAEGVLLAVFPKALLRMMAEMSQIAPERLRYMGLVSAVIGTAMLFILVRALGGTLGFAGLRALIGAGV